MKKLFIAVGLLSLLLAGCKDIGFSAQADEPGQDPFARPAKIATATKSKFHLKKSFPGVTEAARNSVLAFRVGGQVTKLPVLAGQSVAKGNLLAELDATPYENVVEDRQAKFDLALTVLKRTEALYAKKHVAKAALDEAKSSFAAAEVALKSAREDLGYTKLVAPFDGVVAKISIERYQNVKAGSTVINFQGNKNIDINFYVPERLFLSFNPHKASRVPPFEVTFDAMPDKKYVAHYKEHDSIPDPVTRSYKFTVTMPLPEDSTVLPGMSVTVQVDISKIVDLGVSSGVLVPLGSVFDEANKRWVWRLSDDNTTHKTEVEVYGIEDGALRISKGLEDGDRVIAIGVSYVTEGMKVRPYQKERGL